MTDSLEKTWCWERLRAGGEGDDKGWDGWMASLMQWTWVWVNSGSWWWTRRPDITQRRNQASGVPLDILEHLPPKPESAYLTALCFHLHCWHYRGLSPTTSLWKGVNLELQLINLPGITRVFQSKNSSDGSLACLTGLSGHMWLFTASQTWEAQDALNFLKPDSFETLENY